MKASIPKLAEVAIMAVLAVILAAVAQRVGPVGPMLALVTVPLFFVFALLGLHRSGKLQRVGVEAGGPRAR